MSIFIPEKLLRSDRFRNRIEVIFFCGVTLFLLNPLSASKWFLTLDGAAHSYNASVLYKLVFGNDDFLNQFFSVNTLPSPNWTGHILLAFFNEWFGIALAAKIVHLLYGVGLVFAFRWLMFVVSPYPRIMSYLIFPIVLTLVFQLGFYNFCFGVVFMLLGITAWLKYSPSTRWPNVLLLLVLFTAGWFSHQLSWLFTGLFVFISLTVKMIGQRNLRQLLQPLMIAVFSFSPSLIFFTIYTLGKSASTGFKFDPIATRLDFFFSMHSAHILTQSVKPLYELLAVIILAVIVIGVINTYILSKNANREARSLTLLLAIFTALCFGAVLLFPEEAGGGGIFGVRVEWITWIFLLVIVARLRYPKQWLYSFAVVAVFITLSKNLLIKDQAEHLNNNVHAITEAGNYIRERSTIVVYSFSDEVLDFHSGEYAIAGRDVALLNNYETAQEYFPLKNNDSQFPYRFTLASYDPQELHCLNGWKTEKSKPTRQIDYVMFVGNINNNKDTLCTHKLMSAMDSLNYEVVYRKRHVVLYEHQPE